MSLPETLEMDLRKAWVDRSIWLHMWLWYFCDEAVLARLRSLLNTYTRRKHSYKGKLQAWSLKSRWFPTCSMNSMLIRFSISLITRWALHWNILKYSQDRVWACLMEKWRWGVGLNTERSRVNVSASWDTTAGPHDRNLFRNSARFLPCVSIATPIRSWTIFYLSHLLTCSSDVLVTLNDTRGILKPATHDEHTNKFLQPESGHF